MVWILFFQVRFPVGFEKAGALSACLSLQMALDAERRNGEEKKERVCRGVTVGKSYPLGTGIKSWLWLTGKEKICFMKFWGFEACCIALWKARKGGRHMSPRL